MELKIAYDENAIKEAEFNRFKGGSNYKRLWSLFLADVKCHVYLLWAGMCRGECFFVGYDSKGKRCIIGSSKGNMWDGTLTLRRIFWCQRG